jgi:hypothetical protein
MKARRRSLWKLPGEAGRKKEIKSFFPNLLFKELEAEMSGRVICLAKANMTMGARFMSSGLCISIFLYERRSFL